MCLSKIVAAAVLIINIQEQQKCDLVSKRDDREDKYYGVKHRHTLFCGLGCDHDFLFKNFTKISW